jgi:hypothetical protein
MLRLDAHNSSSLSWFRPELKLEQGPAGDVRTTGCHHLHGSCLPQLTCSALHGQLQRGASTLCIPKSHQTLPNMNSSDNTSQHNQAACALTTRGPAAWCSRRGAPVGVQWWVLVGNPRLAAPRSAGWPAASHGCWGAAGTQPPVTNDDKAVAISKGGDSSNCSCSNFQPYRATCRRQEAKI